MGFDWTILSSWARINCARSVAIFGGAGVFLCAAESRGETRAETETSYDYAIERGVVLGARTSILPWALATDMSTGIFVGYKRNRTIFSLATNVVYTHSRSWPPLFFGVETTETRDTSSVMVNPEIQHAFAQFPSANFEFFIQAGLGLIFMGDKTVTSSTHGGVTDGPWSSDNGRVLFDVQVAPGIRIWPHPNMGIAFVAGFDVGGVLSNGDYSGFYLGPRVDLQWMAAF